MSHPPFGLDRDAAPPQPPDEPLIDTLSAEPDLLRRGSTVGSFVIERVLGRDNFDAIYLATSSGAYEVAIEEYFPADIAERDDDGQVRPREDRLRALFDNGLRAFLDETELLAQLRHPALIRMGPAWEARGTAYRPRFVPQGRSLIDWRAARPHAPDEAWLRRTLGALLGALGCVHDAGWVHCNVRPGNVIIDDEGVATLLDLGATRATLAAALPGLTLSPEPQFQAPELRAPRPGVAVSVASDLYALAALADWCISGEAPSDDAGAASHARRLRGGAWSEGLITVLDWALRADPRERPQSVAQMREALARSAPAVAATAPEPEPDVAVARAAEAVSEPDLEFAAEAEADSEVDIELEDELHLDPAAEREPAPTVEAPARVTPERPPFTRAPTAASAAWFGRASQAHKPAPSTDPVFEAAPRSGPVIDAAWPAPFAATTAEEREPPWLTPVSNAAAMAAAEQRADSMQAGPAPWRAAAPRRTRHWPWLLCGLLVGAVAATVFVRGPQQSADALRGLGARLGLLSPIVAAPPAAPAAPSVVAAPPAPATAVTSAPPLPATTAAVTAPIPGTALPPLSAASEAPAGSTTAALLPPAPRAEAPAPPVVTAPPPSPPVAAAPSPPAAAAKAEPAARSITAARSREPAPRPAARTPRNVVAAPPSTPMAVCGSRSNFSLLWCMRQQCERAAYFTHPQCVRLRATDELPR